MGRRRKDPGLDLLFGIAKVGFDVGKVIVKSQQQSKKTAKSRNPSYSQANRSNLSNQNRSVESDKAVAIVFIIGSIFVFIINDSIFLDIISIAIAIISILVLFTAINNKDSIVKSSNDEKSEIEDEFISLIEYCKNGDLESVKRIIAKKPNLINLFAKTNKNTPLMCAITSANIELIKYLLENGANIDAHNAYGITPSELAQRTNNKEILDLIEGKVNAKYGFINKQDTIQKALPKREDTDEFIGLINSCKNGDFERVKLILTKRPQLINQSCKIYQKTPLMYAINAGNLELVKYLLGRGADINAKNKYGATLTELVRRNFLLTNNRGVLDLIEGKVNANCGFTNKQDTIQQALPKDEALEHREEWEARTWEEKQRKNIERYKTLLQSKINEPNKEAIKTISTHNLPDSYIAAFQKNDNEKIRNFIIDGRDPNIKYNGVTPLFYTVYSNDIEMVKFLIEHGASIEIKNDYSVFDNEIIEPFDKLGFELIGRGKTPVDLALEKNYTEIIELFAERYPGNELIADWIRKQFTLAIINDDKEKVERYLNKNIDIYKSVCSFLESLREEKLQDYAFKSIVDLLLEKNNASIIKAVMKYDPSSSKLADWLFDNNIAKIEEFIKYGVDTTLLLCFAIRKRKTDLIELFLNYHNVDINKIVKVYDGYWLENKTPLDFSVSQNMVETTEQLLKAGASPNQNIPLKTACINQNLKIVKLLINYGANPNEVDKEGRTALFEAIGATMANVEIIKFLIASGADIYKEDFKGISPFSFAMTNKKSLLKVLSEPVVSSMPHHNPLRDSNDSDKIEAEMAFTLSITQKQNIELQKKIEELEKQLQKQNNEEISIKKIEATDTDISKVVVRESFSDF